MSKAERTKAFIIEKTAPIFNMKGFAGTSVSDLTAATGLTKGSIYGNFSNKDEVALAVFDHNIQKFVLSIEEELIKEKSFRAKLLAYASCYERFLLPPFTPGGCPVLNTAVEADDTHPQLREKALTALMNWKNKIMMLLEDGLKSGEFSDGINKEQFALTMISMIEGAVMITKLTGNHEVIKTVMNSLRAVIADLK